MKKAQTAIWLMVATIASAITNPPYELFPYVAESTDNPPLNYMKVCEPGVSGEAESSYVVLGISFPRTYQAVNDFSGDLVIPAYIDGLPVRKVNEAAFILSSVRSIKFPHTIREIGARAFADCWYLTNVTFEAGVSTIGTGAFSNCVSLTSVTFPKTLSYLGANCFQGCVELKDVYFLGNAPRLEVAVLTDKSYLGESIFRQWGYYSRFKVHINRNTYGWVAPYEKGVPEKWPVDFGYMQAHVTVAEDGGDSSGGGSSGGSSSGGDTSGGGSSGGGSSGGGSTGGGSTDGGSSAEQQVTPAYTLTNVVADRAVVSLTVNSDHAINAFALKDGKVYDTILYIKNTAEHDVRLKLPSRNEYKTFKGTNPLTIPANSTSILTITRVAGSNAGGNVFLVSREELETVE